MAFSVLHLLLLSLTFLSVTSSASTPLNCSDFTRLCTSFIALRSTPSLTLPLLQSMFDVLPPDLTLDDPSRPAYVFVRKNCSCSATTGTYLTTTTGTYLTTTTLTVREGDGGNVSAYDAVSHAYGPLALFPKSSRMVRRGAVVTVRLVCGCSNGLWNYLVSYVVEEGDNVEILASRFGASMDGIESVNGISDPDDVVVGAVLYIPIDSVPGEPYPSKAEVSPASSPAPVSASSTLPVNEEHRGMKISSGWFVGIIGAAFVLIAILLLVCFLLNSFSCCPHTSRNLPKEIGSDFLHKFHILQRANFCFPLGRYLSCNLGRNKQVTRDITHHQPDIPKVVGDAFDMEKPIIFSYEEILSSTDGFSDANLLGHGTYGSVYYGVLREQEVAVKRMTAMKSKEFLAEMKILCKVHHASLVELIGHAACGDELFVVYEYAQKGPLKNHLHDPQNKGHTPLSWIARVQIALDAAKGLEYIHEHTKTHYVHRDIKTSNILLDCSFRAKISDFGLAKLISKTSDGEIIATKVVGTFGYLAPEYLRDGLATTKSDVYAFGVVLFELISGKEAITRTEGILLSNVERRSLASVMLGALKKSPSSTNMTSLKECIDPNLMNLYPHDCVFKMAVLAKQCVDEDPILRPDMKQVVISLAHILLSSVEWEATLAGNSQVFSGLVQGR